MIRDPLKFYSGGVSFAANTIAADTTTNATNVTNGRSDRVFDATGINQTVNTDIYTPDTAGTLSIAHQATTESTGGNLRSTVRLQIGAAQSGGSGKYLAYAQLTFSFPKELVYDANKKEQIVRSLIDVLFRTGDSTAGYSNSTLDLLFQGVP